MNTLVQYGEVHDDWFDGESYKITLTKKMLPDDALVAELEFRINELRPLWYEFIVIDLVENFEQAEIGEICFFQTRRYDRFEYTHMYTIEFSVKVENGSKLYQMDGDRAQTLQKFREICVERKKPNLSEWQLNAKYVGDEQQDAAETESEKKRKKFEKDVCEKALQLMSLCGRDGNMEKSLADFLYTEAIAGPAHFHESVVYRAKFVEQMLKIKNYKNIEPLFEKNTHLAKVAFAKGEMEFYGYLGKQNLQEAYKYYRHAAKIGSIKAYYRLATIYKYGLGVPKNQTKYLQTINTLCKIATYFKGDAAFTLVEVHLELAKNFAKAKNGIERAIDWCAQGMYSSYNRILLHNGNIDVHAVVELLNLKYSLVEFDMQQATLLDIFYLAQKPCSITVHLADTKVVLQVKQWREYLYVLCAGEKYDNIAIFLSDYLVNGERLIELNKQVEKIEVHYEE